MRPLELTLLATLAMLALAVILRRPWIGLRWGLALAGVVVVVQQVVEGSRWQLVPAYLLLLGLIPPILRSHVSRQHKTSPVHHLIRGSMVLAGIAVAVLIPLAVPVFTLPTPDGEQAVGSRVLHVIRGERDEVYTKDPKDSRELMVRVWYPATPQPEGETIPYWDHALARSRLMAGSWGLPGFFFSHLGRVTTHSYRDAPVLPGKWPVVIFSHGLTQGYPAQNTALAERLASHGYAVFAVAHTFESLRVEFPDGRVVPFDPEVERAFLADVERFKPAHKELLSAAAGGPLDLEGLAELGRRMRAIDRSLQVWSGDISEVIDEVVELGRNRSHHWLAGHLDLKQVAAVGMSFGGASSYQAAMDDHRIGAVVNLDGFPYGAALRGGRAMVPTLLVTSRPGSRWRSQYIFEDGRSPGVHLAVDRICHFDLSDFCRFGPLFRWLGVIGPMSAERSTELTTSVTLAFLNSVLGSGSADALVEISRSFPEATLHTYPGSEK